MSDLRDFGGLTGLHADLMNQCLVEATWAADLSNVNATADEHARAVLETSEAIALAGCMLIGGVSKVKYGTGGWQVSHGHRGGKEPSRKLQSPKGVAPLFTSEWMQELQWCNAQE